MYWKGDRTLGLAIQRRREMVRQKWKPNQKSLSDKRVQSLSQRKSKKRIMASDRGTYFMVVNFMPRQSGEK